MMRCCLLLMMLLVPVLGQAQPVQLDASTIGPPGTGKRQLLFRPALPGRLPAVLVLHPCNGVQVHETDWAQRLVSWNYVALVVDSFGPRGVTTECDVHGAPQVSQEMRAADAFAAAAWLRGQDFVDPARIGAIGFSHGGGTIVNVMLAGEVARNQAVPFNALVAFYPTCRADSRPRLASDTLLLLGDRDEWAPAGFCQTMADHADAQGHVLAVKHYAGAYHLFDVPGPVHSNRAGHILGGDAESNTDSLVQARLFLDARLRR